VVVIDLFRFDSDCRDIDLIWAEKIQCQVVSKHCSHFQCNELEILKMIEAAASVSSVATHPGKFFKVVEIFSVGP